jgi:hypothetical protein
MVTGCEKVRVLGDNLNNVRREARRQCKVGKREYVNDKINALSKGCHLDVVRGPSNPHDPESDAGGSFSFWQGHPSR